MKENKVFIYGTAHRHILGTHRARVVSHRFLECASQLERPAGWTDSHEDVNMTDHLQATKPSRTESEYMYERRLRQERTKP